MLLDFLNPVVPPEITPATYIQMAQAEANQQGQVVLEICEQIEWPDPNPPKGWFPFGPGDGIRLYWNDHPKQMIGSGDLTRAKVTVLEQPRYGILKDLHEIDRDMGPTFAYRITEGTPEGTEDRVVFLVEVGGKRIKVIERFILAANSEFAKKCNGEDIYIRRISQVVDETPMSSYELLQLGMVQGVDYRMVSLQGATLAQTTGSDVQR